MSNEIDKPVNSVEKVHFRESILLAQDQMNEMIKTGLLRDCASECLLKHYFSPIHAEYGCAAYARQIFLPKDSLVIGKIHRHAHLNFILQGKVSVATEFGKKYYQAPMIFISEPGLKRAVFAIEDTVWVTVHLTKYNSEDDLDKIEDEVISPTYAELGLFSETKELLK